MRNITFEDVIPLRSIRALEVGQEVDNGVFKVERIDDLDFGTRYEVCVYSFDGQCEHLRTCRDRFEAVNIMDAFILGVLFVKRGIYEYNE